MAGRGFEGRRREERERKREREKERKREIERERETERERDRKRERDKERERERERERDLKGFLHTEKAEGNDNVQKCHEIARKTAVGCVAILPLLSRRCLSIRD